VAPYHGFKEQEEERASKRIQSKIEGFGDPINRIDNDLKIAEAAMEKHKRRQDEIKGEMEKHERILAESDEKLEKEGAEFEKLTEICQYVDDMREMLEYKAPTVSEERQRYLDSIEYANEEIMESYKSIGVSSEEEFESAFQGTR